ncbi:MAG: hypothetical protein CUN49_17315 [Candidatus Thermofonsia Clade 1 bacterium]|uniref:Serine/threonine protein kinase n=1 Tax=Candidatus Thermofonsia Clade 1 bacterium TaxID=2364210 RepID=A0A2M8P8U0_9CHLR|nr:MAG: hypothetical protein CUN49_17315 [Candidatus Thermofonsia Clade 1 bacterium]
MPFVANTPYRVMYMHMNDQPPALQKYDPALPESLNAVIQRAMAKAPEDRFPSAVALVEAFEEALRAVPSQVNISAAQQSPLAAEPKASPNTTTPTRRRWLLIGLIMVVALSAIVIAVMLSGRS